MSSLSKSASSSSDEGVELRRGPWTLEEDTLLIHYIASHGEGHWNLLAKRSELKRTGKSCRLRWLNYLKPDVKRGNLTPQEQLLILELHSKWGNRWSKIAKYLPGRTDNEIKNYWRTRVQKQAKHLKIDCNSRVFQEVIRCFWMPRLLQKIHSSSSPCLAISSQNSDAHTLTPANEHSILQPLPLPPQVPEQGPFHIGETACMSLDHGINNSSSEHCSSTSPSVSSSESMNMSQIPQISEYQTSSSFHGMNNIEYNTLVKACYNVDNISYDMETIGLATISAPGDYVTNPNGKSNTVIDDDLDESLWNMGELWQATNTYGYGYG